MRTSRFFTPCSCAARPADSAATCAAKGVDLREPLKPAPPEVAQESALPWRSVMVMMVLLKEAWTWAMPSDTTFFTFLRARVAAGLTMSVWFPRSGSLGGGGGLGQPHGLARPLAGARVGASTLAAHGQALLVAHAAVAAE